MTSSLSDQVLDYLEIAATTLKSRPAATDVYSPNYAIYGCAPYWTLSQAVCLLCGIATLDEETYYTLKSFDFVQEKVKLGLKGLAAGKKASDYKRFGDYVAFEFPIKARTITHLKNLALLVKDGIKLGLLKCGSRNEPKKELLNPVEVITWAKDHRMNISAQLLESISQRQAVNFLLLPEVFPNEIYFNADFNVARIERNRSMPISPSSLGVRSHDGFNSPLSSPQSSVGASSDSKVLCESVEVSVYSTLNDVERNLSLPNFLYHICSPQKAESLGKDGVAQVLKILKEKAPCPLAAFKRTTWGVEEAVLAYHNISPTILEDALGDSDYRLQRRIMVVLLDKEEQVYRNFINYLQAVNEGRVPLQITLDVFVNYLKEKNYIVPKHFSDNGGSPAISSNALSVKDVGDSNSDTLNEAQRAVFDEIITYRHAILEECYIALYKDPKDRAMGRMQLERIAIPNIEEFKNKSFRGVTVGKLQEHKYRVIGAVIRTIDPQIRIPKIESHPLMVGFVKHEKKPSKSKTVRVWMNRERLFDRDPKNHDKT